MSPRTATVLTIPSLVFLAEVAAGQAAPTATASGPPISSTVAVCPACPAPVTCPDPMAFTSPLEKQIERLNHTIADRDATIVELQGKMAKQDDTIRVLTQESAKASAQNATLLVSLKAAQADVARNAGDAAEKKLAAERATRAYKDAEARYANSKQLSRDEQARLKQLLDAAEEQKDAAEHAYALANNKLTETSATLFDANRKYEEASSQLQKKNGELDAAQRRAENAEKELALHRALIASTVLAATTLLPVLILCLYVILLRRGAAGKIKDLKKTFMDAAVSIRMTRDGTETVLLKTEELLIEDTVGARVLFESVRDALRVAIFLSLGGAVALTVFALCFTYRIANEVGQTELVRNTAWQALIGLFTPVASLIAGITFAHSRYRDILAQCAAADLVVRPPPRPPQPKLPGWLRLRPTSDGGGASTLTTQRDSQLPIERRRSRRLKRGRLPSTAGFVEKCHDILLSDYPDEGGRTSRDRRLPTTRESLG